MKEVGISNSVSTNAKRAFQDELAVFCDLEPEIEDFGGALTAGLSTDPKTLPCKFFYDKRGSEIFDKICELEEYYVTRTELGLLDEYAAEMLRFCGDNIHLIEFGSGSSQKVRKLLDSGEEVSAYSAIDISRDHLIDSCVAVADVYPQLPVSAICADYTGPFDLPELPAPGSRKIGYFPGSSIGNFTREDAALFLKRAAKLLGNGSGMLIGIDLKKDPALLHAAYNDFSGVTAEFNLNLLHRAKKELGVPIDVSAFRHDAVYNAQEGRIEMYLVSVVDQSVEWRGARYDFSAGERIHTENSYKYSVEEIEALAAGAGYRLEQSWIDANRLFSVHFLSLEG